MKKLLLLTLTICLGQFAYSQCQVLDNFQNFANYDLTPSVQGPTGTQSSYSTWGGDYHKVDVVAGETYEISTCRSGPYMGPADQVPNPGWSGIWPFGPAAGQGGYNRNWDPQLSLVEASTGLVIAHNDDYCGDLPAITYLATFTGELFLVFDSATVCDQFEVDSIVVDVTWLFGCSNTTSSFSVTECSSYTVPSGDETYTAIGTYTVMDTILNSENCDSIMTINLTINNSADIPILSGPTEICDGDNVTIDISGNLNDASYWAIYTDSCGGTLVDTTSLDSIVLTPTAPITTYYVIGESCGGSSCSSITIRANPLVQAQVVSPLQQSICDSGAGVFNIADSETGVNYYLRDDVTNAIVAGPVAGNDTNITITGPAITSTTTYNIYGENAPQLSLGLDGNNDFWFNVDAPVFTQNDVTMELWVYWDGNMASKNIAGIGDTSSRGYHIKLNSSGQPYLLLGGAGTINSNQTITSGVWTHIAVTGSATNVWTIYINGQPANSATIVANSPFSSSNFLIGGNSSAQEAFGSRVDELRVWSTHRSQTEIAENMAQCFTGSEPNMAAYYSFEGNVNDLTGNGFNLTPGPAVATYPQGYPTCAFCSSEMLNTVEVVINTSVTQNFNDTICAGDSTLIFGSYQSITGTYYDSLTTTNGCDSIQVMDLLVLPALTGSVTNTICNTDSVVVNGTTYNASNPSGTEVFTNVGPNNCDSTVTVNLTVDPAIDVSITNTSPTLTANQSGATYQWVDCDNANAPIPTETGQSFTATANGNYAVEITVSGCTETSACENVTGVGIKENIQNHVSIYPNPTTGIFTINLGNYANTINYSISSIEGRMIEQGKTSQNIITIDLNDQSKGIYFLRLNDGNDSQVFKIMKQ